MKQAIPATIVAALALIAAAPSADAKPHHRGKKYYPSHVYVSGYRSCGTPIYTERYVRYYQRCGTPVWGYRTVSPPYRDHCEPRHHYYHQPPVCPPPPPRCQPSGGRVIIQGILGF